MLSLGLIYLLTSSILFAVAVVVHFHSYALSLPFSPVISMMTAILPIAGFINAFIFPSLLYTSSHRPAAQQPGRLSRQSSTAVAASHRLRELIPFILQSSQAIVTAVLATILFAGAVPSQGLSCVLENRWMGLFRAHDATSIRQIQDILECCGLNSVKDRAYPFPRDGRPSTCAETYGREVACQGPWTSAMRSNTGIDLGVVLAVGLLQILGLVMMREGTNWWTAWRTRGWQPDMGQRESTRPLLTAEAEGEDEEEAGEGSSAGARNYGTANDEEEAGPRIMPSSAITERNAWNEQ